MSQSSGLRNLEDLVQECREFMTIKNRCTLERNPAAGSPMYLVTKRWLKAYKEYVLYSEVKRNNKPAAPEVDKHPGTITNDEDLCDSQDINLKGTGTIEQFDSNCVDKYVKADVRERLQFKIVNQELWTFLHSKYGGSEIKRYAIPLSYYSTSIEVRLKLIPVIILPTSKLIRGGEQL